ncbi:hypothetical protein BJ994_003345 [Arthrobacter pigmenti]|uniref:Uncharacterized protein n=1 Tax=Arthrobacter pigmenti TaxID=271432 RepID=A0A846RT93_9MICC|nr:hypothetical protein [Arthrobacter pigmenti]NJC24269.1 hypothetical protein [Arthrobacter pigmenti]
MQGSFALLLGGFCVFSAIVLHLMLKAIGRRNMNPWRNERITESMRHRARLLICGLLAGVGVYIAIFYGIAVGNDELAESVRFPLCAMAVGISWFIFRQEIALYQRELIFRRFATGEDPVSGLRMFGTLFASLMFGVGLLLLVILVAHHVVS